MRSPKRWALAGAVLLALGLLPILSGTGRTLLLAGGVLVLLLTMVAAFRDESRPERPEPPGA
jgi:hypothetical protein